MCASPYMCQTVSKIDRNLTYIGENCFCDGQERSRIFFAFLSLLLVHETSSLSDFAQMWLCSRLKQWPNHFSLLFSIGCLYEIGDIYAC